MRTLKSAIKAAHLYFISGSSKCLKDTYKTLALLLFIALAHGTSASAIKDTVGLAKQYRSEGKIKEAVGLLKNYHEAHTADLNSSWLYAQTLYWLKDYKHAKQVYAQTIASHPANYYLQLDYVNVLLADRDLKHAKTLLTSYRKFDSTSAGYKSALTGLFWLDEHHQPNDPLYRNLSVTAADTLNRIKQLKGNQQATASYKLMKAYYKNHAGDFNTTWVYGQVAYLNKHFKQSKSLYRKAIATHPDNYYLKLDYAKTLVSIADYKEARPLLDSYYTYDHTNPLLDLGYAHIFMAHGQYDKAKWEIDAVLKQDPKNADALALLDELHLARASWLKIKAGYYDDSQPLKTINPAVEAGVYLHPEATLRLNLQTPVFIGNGSVKNAQWLQIGDQSAFHKAGFQLSFDAGVIKQPYANKISWSGNVELKQTLVKHLVLQAQVERKPYYYTLSSLDTVLMENRYSAYVEWNDQNSFNGRIGFELNHFPDKNFTVGAGGWVFTPPLKISVIEMRIGYAYSFSTAKSNRFIPQNTLAEAITAYTSPITGVYSPYFTPDNMGIHAALASIVVHPVKMLDIGFNANVGFYATNLTPYFFLNKDADNNTFIDKGYANEKFTPMEFSAYAYLRITKKISLKAEYAYRKTYFYTSNSAGLGLKINFWNEQKGK